jgi:hypothetical protein
MAVAVSTAAMLTIWIIATVAGGLGALIPVAFTAGHGLVGGSACCGGEPIWQWLFCFSLQHTRSRSVCS